MGIINVHKRGKKRYALLIGCFLVFVAGYKITMRHTFTRSGTIAQDSAVHYGGISTGELTEFIQTGKETCGHAVLAFFLTKIGIPTTEQSIIEQFSSASMLSLADLEKIFINHGFKTQLIKVSPEYFKKHPVTAILHLTEKHYIVFLGEENGEASIFDPAYGMVYLPWNKLLNLFSGYMLYVYT
jgi:hypothetical protein